MNLNKADLLLVNNLKKLTTKGLYSTDENPRGRYESDGAPAHSRFITHSFETYNLSEGEFPIPTLLDTAHKMGLKEMLWIYQDQSNELSLLKEKYNVHWWDLWDIGDGTIGQRYGATVKKYDLMNKLLDGLLNNPFGRRHVMSMWQDEDFNTPGLNPCAFLTEWAFRKRSQNGYYLDLMLHQRSNDYITAGYINKTQYVQLLMLVVGHLRFHGVDVQVGKFSHYTNNLHIYDRHIDLAEHILNLSITSDSATSYQFPTYTLKAEKDFYDYTVDDIETSDYLFFKKPYKPELAV